VIPVILVAALMVVGLIVAVGLLIRDRRAVEADLAAWHASYQAQQLQRVETEQ
jgi:hypothetical protein